jgi:putative heme iron utilization protein
VDEARPHGEGGPSALANEALELIAGSARGVLCTLLPAGGEPYGSIVDLLPLANGDAVLFLSGLAEHRKNLDADARASLLIGPAIGTEDALTQPRATIVGRAERLKDRAEFRGAYLRAHPGASAFIDFPDFAFYRLRADRVRYIAGFGRMGWVPKSSLTEAGNP